MLKLILKVLNMNNPMVMRNFREKLEGSNYGSFDAVIKSESDYLEYACVKINCCNYEYHKKLVEAVQPILNELKIEMDDLLQEPNDGEDI